MFVFLAFANKIDRAVSFFGKAGSLLILPLIFITVFDVISRKFVFIQSYILNSPFYQYISPTKLQELEWHLHAAIFLLAFGFAYINNTHVRVDLFREKRSIKKQLFTELLGLLFLALPYLAVLLFYAYGFVESAYIQQEVSSALTGLPYRWIIKSILLLGVVLLTMAIISTLIRLLLSLFAKPELAQQAIASLSFLHIVQPDGFINGQFVDKQFVDKQLADEHLIEEQLSVGAYSPDEDKSENALINGKSHD